MAPVLIFMSVVVGVAVLALAYAAFPHRGAPVPGASWLSDVLERAADAVPTVEDGDLDPVGADDASDAAAHEGVVATEPSRR